ncbi:hypothetical protein TH63_12900 [Rufibacter radiotolerans]|uniref:Uncharacterized protein n=1 Tax=Rufibacter radiotolerans TaxID=1379910 RepID=A0A0H4VRC6_9BACT|nr:hypothetical protein [Rufibacter radiotolerans]AKQ46314.1 hypothetical protein TH63_12900 [Rufibacter radiotolerans]
MKHTTLLLGALLALAACKQETTSEKTDKEAQLEEAAGSISEDSELDPTLAADASDTSAPTTANDEAMSEEPLPGATSTASAAPSAANPLFNLTLQAGQAGAVKIGMTIEELKKQYGQNKIRETEHSIEGTTTKAYEILGERRRPDLLVEQQCKGNVCTVFRITVLNPSFRTQGGIGIGSMFRDVKESIPISSVGAGEGNFVAISEGARMSFVLDMRGIPAQRWNKLKVKDIPNTTMVSGIMLW